MQPCDICWHGQGWLCSGIFPDPYRKSDTNKETKKREKCLVMTTIITIPDRDVFILTKYNSFYKVFRIIANIERPI